MTSVGLARVHPRGYNAGPHPASDLAATVVAGPQVNLSWSDNSSDEDGFKIQRRDATAEGAWGLVHTTAANVEVWEGDVGAFTEGHKYQYRVVAYNAITDASPSNVMTVTPNMPSSGTAYFRHALKRRHGRV